MCWSSFRMNCGKMNAPSRNPVSQRSATRPSMMTLVSRILLLVETGGMASTSNKILDTSVIIDGRVADLCETGFLEGAFILPQFILNELQHIAHSSDPLKRGRGRRGLDVLNKIQKMVDIEVRIVEEDFPHIKEVDSKIVMLAKKMNRSEEHTSELQSLAYLVCRLLLEKKKK